MSNPLYCERCIDALATTTAEQPTGPNSSVILHTCQDCKNRIEEGPSEPDYGEPYYPYYSAEEQHRIQRDLK